MEKVSQYLNIFIWYFKTRWWPYKRPRELARSHFQIRKSRLPGRAAGQTALARDAGVHRGASGGRHHQVQALGVGAPR